MVTITRPCITTCIFSSVWKILQNVEERMTVDEMMVVSYTEKLSRTHMMAPTQKQHPACQGLSGGSVLMADHLLSLATKQWVPQPSHIEALFVPRWPGEATRIKLSLVCWVQRRKLMWGWGLRVGHWWNSEQPPQILWWGSYHGSQQGHQPIITWAAVLLPDLHLWVSLKAQNRYFALTISRHCLCRVARSWL